MNVFWADEGTLGFSQLDPRHGARAPRGDAEVADALDVTCGGLGSSENGGSAE